MSPAKVTLSPKERELVTDAGWILTKNRIIGKVYTLFGHLSETYNECYRQSPLSVQEPPGFASPKIAKGEQYRGLPWVVLDQPRHFTAKDIFAVRSFFWWGNFCSITLQLSGASFEVYGKAVERYFDQSPQAVSGWWIGVGEDPWQHHFETDNYRMLSEKPGIRFRSLSYLKLAKKISLAEWDNLPAFFTGTYSEILQMLCS